MTLLKYIKKLIKRLKLINLHLNIYQIKLIKHNKLSINILMIINKNLIHILQINLIINSYFILFIIQIIQIFIIIIQIFIIIKKIFMIIRKISLIIRKILLIVVII